MIVADEHVSALRALLVGDVDTYHDVSNKLSTTDMRNGFPVLMAMAFTLAVKRRFTQGYTVADVIRFVANVRIKHGKDFPIEPRVAEQLILSALRDVPIPANTDQSAKADAQFALLSELIDDAQLTGIELDAFLAEARANAERFATP